MPTPKVDLLVAPCSHKAAKWAVEHWHYSQSMPAGKLVKFGVWENGDFVGCVLYGRGAAMNIGKPYNLEQVQICELVRVALKSHESKTTQIVSTTLRQIKKDNPGLRLIVSYADTSQGHEGTIYQAMNWLYVGDSVARNQILFGETLHPKTVYSRYGRQDIAWLRAHVDPNAKWIDCEPKRKYLYPLDRAMRRQIEQLAQPYPKRADVGEIESRTGSTG